jgi:large conductance mechanosensitive channel
MKGFKEFLLRGNVIDLAVAVVVGTAFSAIVNSLVSNIFNPAIGALFKAESLSDLWIVEIPSTDGEPAQIMFGAVVAAVIQFVLVAAVVYFALVVPINFLKKRAFKEQQKVDEEAPAVVNEVDVLVEIRDLLKAQSAAQPK